MADPTDVERMLGEMPKPVYVQEIEDYGHGGSCEKSSAASSATTILNAVVIFSLLLLLRSGRCRRRLPCLRLPPPVSVLRALTWRSDFVWGQDAKDVLYPQVVQLISQYQSGP